MSSARLKGGDPFKAYSGKEKRRKYTRKKDWGENIKIIQELHGKQISQVEMKALLASKGFEVNDSSLKHRLRGSGISRRNTNRVQRNFIRRKAEEAIARGQEVPRFAFVDTKQEIAPLAVKKWLKQGYEEEDLEGDKMSPGILVLPPESSNASRKPSELLVVEKELIMAPPKSQAFSMEAEDTCDNFQSNPTDGVNSDLHQCTSSTFDSQSEDADCLASMCLDFARKIDGLRLDISSPEVIDPDLYEFVKEDYEWWSNYYYRLDYENWLAKRKENAAWIVAAVKNEMFISGDDERTCRLRFQTTWRRREWEKEYVCSEPELLPLSIYESFFDESPKSKDNFTLAQHLTLAEEERSLRKIYTDHFPDILKVGRSLSEQFPDSVGYRFKSQVMHTLSIAETFGQNSYLLLQATTQLSRLLLYVETVQTHTTSSLKAVRKSILKLSKLQQAKIERMGLGDTTEALRVLGVIAQVEDRMGNVDAALAGNMNCHKVCRRMGVGDHSEFHKVASMIQRGKTLLSAGDKAAGIELLRQCLAYSTYANKHTQRLQFGTSHGHFNTANNFWRIAEEFAKEGYTSEAIMSYEATIFHMERSGEANKHAVVSEFALKIGELHMSVRNFRSAMECWEKHFLYRTSVWGVKDDRAAFCMEAIANMMEKVNCLSYLRPSLDRVMLAPSLRDTDDARQVYYRIYCRTYGSGDAEMWLAIDNNESGTATEIVNTSFFTDIWGGMLPW